MRIKLMDAIVAVCAQPVIYSLKTGLSKLALGLGPLLQLPKSNFKKLKLLLVSCPASLNVTAAFTGVLLIVFYILNQNHH